MPELPEAETIVRSLRPRVEGRRITGALFLAARVSQDDPAALVGRRIQQVRRHGKHIHFVLDGGVLAVKLGMTGNLLLGRDPGPYTRAILDLGGLRLCFDDIRQFGSMTLGESPGNHLGPDPLEITAAEFAQRVRARSRAVKTALLDQSLIRGVGNIYADEALFAARIHPKARTNRLKPERARRLHGAIVEVLELAIHHKGSSISDYVDAFGDRGAFQSLHRVYGREGEPCTRCAAAIRRIVLGQRSAHYCPRCQRI